MNFDYCSRVPFQNKHVDELKKAYDIVFSKKEWHDALCLASKALLDGKNVKENCEQLMEACGVHAYTLFDLVLIEALPALEHSYKMLGLDSALFDGVIVDIRAKTVECENVYQIVGNNCYDWYIGFYDCTRLCLGRLQFEKRELRFDYKDYKKGDVVINTHIPSIGPLKYEDVMNSFKMAYKYFGDTVKDGVLPIVCSSWLLHDKTSLCFKKGGGLEMFYNMFDVIYNEDHDTNRNFWRIFDCEYKDFDKVPADTSLRRNILNMIKSGQNMGAGYGVILFDGEKIKENKNA